MNDTPLFDFKQTHWRSAAVEDVRDDGIIVAKLAPYEVEGQIGPRFAEVFTAGCFGRSVGNPNRVKLKDQGHDPKSLGKALQLRDAPDGIYGELAVSDTAAGRDLLTLLRDGVLDEMSVEFKASKRYSEISRRADGSHLIRHDRAELVGVSPVDAGAYGADARILSVRDADRDDLDRRRELAIMHLRSLTAGPGE